MIKIHVAGNKNLTIDPGIDAECGHIKDGIVLKFNGDVGPWMISFRDLERVYSAAKAARSKRKEAQRT